MSTLLWIILATLINGLVALIGAFCLIIKEKTLNRILLLFVAFSAGALIAGAFFHLIPESIEKIPYDSVALGIIIGFVIFFLIERFLHWHHCHKKECGVHPVSYLILFGDGIHNFIDGLIIAASFLVDIKFGIITTLIIIAHELPQELGDFGVLIYSGFEKIKALFYNFLAQLTAVIGGIVGYFICCQEIQSYLLPFAAGGFIYIAASDLIPELHQEKSLKKSFVYLIFFLIGIGLIIFAKTVIGE
jgi:zinc and cadmium transporter